MVYVSGYWSERDQGKKLRLFSDGRKIKVMPFSRFARFLRLGRGREIEVRLTLKDREKSRINY